MSVVALKKNKSGIIDVVSDSICVRGYTKMQDTMKFAKLFRGNDAVFGGAGHATELTLLQAYSQTHLIGKNPTINSVLNYLVEFCDYKKKLVDKWVLESEVLIVPLFGNGIFQGNTDMGIWEIEEYSALGAGMDYALAALYLGKSAEDSVKTACALSIYCSLPTNIEQVHRK